MKCRWTVNPFGMTAPLPAPEREAFMLFACTVHGKSADMQARKCNILFGKWRGRSLRPDIWGPMTFVENISASQLEKDLREVGMGQYRRIVKMWKGLSHLYFHGKFDVQTLQQIPGMGPKTAQFIAAYTGLGDYAVLDVHVLRWLRRQGYDVPPQTPQDEQDYARCSRFFAREAAKHSLSKVELDALIWNKYVRKGRK